ncbi:MAG: hypothetical protein QOK48_2060 [Blastocatellia bacterium]|nr:hypothetical protein [Blastocatellia bacterium]
MLDSKPQWNISRLPNELTVINVFARSERARAMVNED